MVWKKPKSLTRLTIKAVWGGEKLTYYEDILESEYEDLPDLMTDLHCHYDWLLWDEDTDWEITTIEDVEIWDWKEFRSTGRIRGFYKNFGFGEKISICFL